MLKYITVECNDKTRLIVVSNSPAFLCWTDAYMLRHSCLTLARANHLMCHTVIQANSLMHAPSICMISNRLGMFLALDACILRVRAVCALHRVRARCSQPGQVRGLAFVLVGAHVVGGFADAGLVA
jgi:hypothetical protein